MSVEKFAAEIRDRINAGRKQHELLARPEDWNMLCSALDVIGDTELGLHAYSSHSSIEDPGLCYLHIYGALQLLQVQQDAADQVCRALGIKPSASPKIPEIRKVRNSAVGHPWRQTENKIARSNFIVRAFLSQYRFTLMTVFADVWEIESRPVLVPKLIEQQQVALSKTLQEVISKLDEAEMNHRQQFRDKKLADCFPHALGYYFRKIIEGTYSDDHYQAGEMHVELVSKCLDEMEKLLRERGEWDIHSSIDYKYEELRYPLEQLKGFFSDQSSSKLNEKDARIFCEFAENHVNVLREIAEEIDEHYEASP